MISEWNEFKGCPNCGIVPYTIKKTFSGKVILDSPTTRASRRWCHNIYICSQCKQEYNQFDQLVFKHKEVPDSLIYHPELRFAKTEKKYIVGQGLW